MFSPNNDDHAPIVVKIQHAGGFVRRRFDRPLALTLQDLYDTAGLSASTGSQSKLTYVDEEGDAITIATDKDVQEAVAFARETSARSVRIKIENEPESAAKKTDARDETHMGNPWANFGASAQSTETENGRDAQETSQQHSQSWMTIRQIFINASFVILFGSMFFRLLFAVISSTFGVFFLLGNMFLKLVPLILLAGLYLKVSGMNKGAMKKCYSHCWRPEPDLLKRFIRSKFKMSCPCSRKNSRMPTSGQPSTSTMGGASKEATAASSAPLVEETSPDLTRLQTMGFNRVEAQRALSQANNDLADALQILLSTR